MVTKAEIQSIDFAGNTCVVRMPYFESAAGGDKAIATAIFSNTPGTFNGYKVGDIVLVAFEDGQAQQPCVIGKLYLGMAEENKEARGTINAEALTSSSTNSLPLSTKLTSDAADRVEVKGGDTSYKSIRDIINQLQNLSTELRTKADDTNVVHLNTKETITGDKTVAVGTKLIFADQSGITHSIYSDEKDKLLINRKDNTVMLFNKANTVVNNDLRINTMGTAATSAATKSYVDNYLTTITGYNAAVDQILEHDDKGNIKWVNK